MNTVRSCLTYMRWVGLALCLSAATTDAQTTPPYPQLTGLVTDHAQLLSTSEASRLTALVSDYEKRTTTEIAIVILNSIRPATNITAYGTSLANHYGIGKRDKNNGVLLLVALKDRQVRLDVGLGLEKALPDAVAKGIIDEQMIPPFKRNRHAEGILAGVTAVMHRLDEANTVPEDASRKPADPQR